MKTNPSEYHETTRQTRPGCGSNIRKASFIERRLFYLKNELFGRLYVSPPDFVACFGLGDFAVQLCYKGK
jgi:hypothetical protein